ncbi:hypothetical protein OG552_31455 [Streptomyces sp. NBC_01476]|uniref:hypothetical protein n=1 Tax=Streptomyces sp. NBC_01476 TaxID=2903881 RepID=UPI002E36E84D|nr:hypothetical protein [Streptomyces sp. NBC_01476]
MSTLLAAETGAGPSDPLARLVAAQLISLLRLLTSQEARRAVGSRPEAERRAAPAEWIDTSAELVGGGLKGYAVRLS